MTALSAILKLSVRLASLRIAWSFGLVGSNCFSSFSPSPSFSFFLFIVSVDSNIVRSGLMLRANIVVPVAVEPIVDGVTVLVGRVLVIFDPRAVEGVAALLVSLLL